MPRRAMIAAVPASASHYDGHDLEALAGLTNYARWIVEPMRAHLGRAARILEVGAGIGTISALLRPHARTLTLVEPAQNLRRQLEARFAGDAGVQVIPALLEDAVAGRIPGVTLSPGELDAAVLVNVLEHVDDEVALLRTVRGLLRPAGTLALFVPAHAFLFGSLDRLVGHVRRYERSTLQAAVRAAGLIPMSTTYMDVLGALPWLVAGRVLRFTRFDQGSARLYDRFGVPLTAWLERRISAPFGKNLLCIARVPA